MAISNEGQTDRNPALGAELVRLKVDVIVAAGLQRDPSSKGSDQPQSRLSCYGAAILSEAVLFPIWRGPGET